MWNEPITAASSGSCSKERSNAPVVNYITFDRFGARSRLENREQCLYKSTIPHKGEELDCLPRPGVRSFRPGQLALITLI